MLTKIHADYTVSITELKKKPKEEGIERLNPNRRPLISSRLRLMKS